MHIRVIRCVIIIILFVFATSTGSAEDKGWNNFGFRTGINDNRKDEYFSKYEAYVICSLPWKQRSEQGWIFAAFVEFNAGILVYDDNGVLGSKSSNFYPMTPSQYRSNAFVGSIGPGIYLMTPTKIVVISAGIYPTYIEQSAFGARDFGESFQFTSEFGVNFNFFRHLTIGYRFQHMSNGGIFDENAGLNTHMFELGYRF